MTDNPVRTKFRDRPLVIPKVGGDNWDAYRARRANVGNGITDHDGGLRFPVGRTYRTSQDLRIRLLHAEGVLAADRNKAIGEP